MASPLFLQLRNGYYFLIRSLLFLTGHNRRFSGQLARLLGMIRYRIGYVGKGRDRDLYLHTIRQALPGLPPGEERAVLKSFWRNHQASFLDLFMTLRLTPGELDRRVVFEGLEHLDELHRQGRGAIMATMHLGDERLLHVLLGLRGYPLRVLSADFGGYGRAAREARLRAAGAFHPVETSGSKRWMYRSLSKGEFVFLAVSGFGGRRGAWVDLMGRDVLFSTAPARLARKTGLPVIPAVCIRLEGNRYLINVGPPLPPEDGPSRNEEAIHEFTTTLVRQFDRWIEAHPGQFNWMWYIIRDLETDSRLGMKNTQPH